MGSVLNSSNGDSPASRKTALVVGEDAEIYHLLTGILNPRQWSIEQLPGNAAALARVKAAPCELILTDPATPAAEQIEFLRAIRTADPGARIILLMDEAAGPGVIAAIRENAFSCFSKPYPIPALTEMVKLATQVASWDDAIQVLSAAPGWIRLRVRCEADTADRLMQFFNEMAQLPPEDKHAVAMACREMLMNAMEHGGHFDPNEYVELSYIQTKQMVMCRLKDPGAGFCPDQIQHAAIANPPEDPIRHVQLREDQGMRTGGYGVLLARQLVDDVIYGEKGNEVLLIKYLNPPGA